MHDSSGDGRIGYCFGGNAGAFDLAHR